MENEIGRGGVETGACQESVKPELWEWKSISNRLCWKGQEDFMFVRPVWMATEIEGIPCEELIGLPYYEQVVGGSDKPRYAVATDLFAIYNGFAWRKLPVREPSLENLKQITVRLCQRDLMAVLSRVQESLGMVDLELRSIQRDQVLAPVLSAA